MIKIFNVKLTINKPVIKMMVINLGISIKNSVQIALCYCKMFY